MSTKTGIEWTDATWNPIRGCSRVSEGCRNCYAEGVAYRFSGPGQPYEGLVTMGPLPLAGREQRRNRQWNGQIKFVEERLLDPLRWKKPRRIFVNSMSDLFHPNVTEEMLDRIFAVMALCPQHTFQVLTKRPERMLAYLSDVRTPRRICAFVQNEKWQRSIGAAYNVLNWPLPNVWLGVSVENQKAAHERISLLLQTPAAVRFLSCEPLLGPVDLNNICAHQLSRAMGHEPDAEELEEPWKFRALEVGDLYHGGSGDISDGPERTAKIDWVIVGGESGPGARPMHPDWARSLRDQCVTAGVPFFCKQWGEWAEVAEDPRLTDLWLGEDGNTRGDYLIRGDACMRRVGKKVAGRLLDGREWNEFPEVRA